MYKKTAWSEVDDRITVNGDLRLTSWKKVLQAF